MTKVQTSVAVTCKVQVPCHVLLLHVRVRVYSRADHQDLAKYLCAVTCQGKVIQVAISYRYMQFSTCKQFQNHHTNIHSYVHVRAQYYTQLMGKYFKCVKKKSILYERYMTTQIYRCTCGYTSCYVCTCVHVYLRVPLK